MIELKISAQSIASLRQQLKDILSNSGPEAEIGEWLDDLKDDGIIIPVETAVETAIQTPVETAVETAIQTPVETDVDSKNRPWDERIHSTAKSKNTDGSWKIVRRPKRFDDDPLAWKGYVHHVLAELSGGPVAIDPTVSNTEQSAETEDPTPQEDLSQAFGNGATTTPINVNAEQKVPEDLPAFLMFMTNNSEFITTADVMAVCAKYGVPEMMGLFDPQHINVAPVVYNELLSMINNAT